jgi:hypothetical protein
MKTRTLVLIGTFIAILLVAAGVYLIWRLREDQRTAHDRLMPYEREVWLYDFPSEDTAVRASLERLSQELRQHTQELFKVRWSLAKSGPAPSGTLYNRNSKDIGYAYDADSGVNRVWTNVDELTIHALAEKHGRLEDLRPNDWGEETGSKAPANWPRSDRASYGQRPKNKVR